MSLEQTLPEQLSLLGQAVITGTAMGIYYDLFRIIRRVFRLSYGTVMSQDLFFWITSAIAVFFAGVIPGVGVLRVNFVLTTLACAALYCMSVGSFAVYVVSGALNGVKKGMCGLLGAVRRLIMSPKKRPVEGNGEEGGTREAKTVAKPGNNEKKLK